MSTESKLIVTTGTIDAKVYSNGAAKFRLPCPAHLIVADLSKTPCGDLMPVFDHMVVRNSLVDTSYTKCFGPEIIICETGIVRILILVGATNPVEDTLVPGEALFVPKGAMCAWDSVKDVVLLNHFGLPHSINQVRSSSLLFGKVRLFTPVLGQQHMFAIDRSLLVREGASMDLFRRYYLWKPVEVGRWYADHAHVEGEELFVCRSGKVEVEIFYNNPVPSCLQLKPGDMLYIPTRVWHRVRSLEAGSSLSVLSDRSYDRETYAESFQTYLASFNRA